MKRLRFKPASICLFLGTLILWAGILSCGNTPKQKELFTNCNLEVGQSCGIESKGSRAIWRPARINKREDYVIVIASGDFPGSQKNGITFIVNSSTSSAPLSPKERHAVELLRLQPLKADRLPTESGAPAAQKETKNLHADVLAELAGTNNTASEHIFHFLTRPNKATFKTEDVADNPSELSRSQGLNALLVYHVMRRAGATLNATDSVAQKILSQMNRSSDTLKTMSEFLNVSTFELQQSFFTSFVKAMFFENKNGDFLPELESSGPFMRGIRLLNRTDSYERLPYEPPVVHPYQIDLPLVPYEEKLTLPENGVSMYRFIAPRDIRSGGYTLTIESRELPLSIFVVRVK